jgi:hypothetical protein
LVGWRCGHDHGGGGTSDVPGDRPRLAGVHRLLATLIALGALALALAACSDDDGDSGDDGDAATTTEVAETADSPAKLPSDWERQVNEQAGFSIGIPPGWSVRPTEGGQGNIITAPDELIVLTVTADRTAGALQLPLDEFATRTAEAFDSEVVGAQRFENLRITRAVPFKGTYDAVAVRAIGRSRDSDVRERLLVVVLRREGQAAYVVISRENAETESKVASRQDIEGIIRSLRGRPPA